VFGLIARRPQIMKVVTKLGCACTLQTGQRVDASGAYALEQLDMVDPAGYLVSDALKKVLLYHSQAGRDRGVLGLFDADARRATLVIVARQGGQLQRVNARRLARELDMDDSWVLDLEYAVNMAAGWKAMQMAVVALQREEGSAATLLVLQSPTSLKAHMKARCRPPPVFSRS
jgi:hypothetical protein